MVGITITLTDGAVELLDQVVRNGLHGDDRGRAVEQLVCQSLESRRTGLMTDIMIRPTADVGVGPGAHA